MGGWPEGWGRIVLDETGSTNDEARARAAALGAPTWIMARRQTRARGREGRAWSSPEGNLAATLAMELAGPPAAAATLSFDAALATADLVAASAPAARVALKWPNDVLADGRKIAGILLESWMEGGRRFLAIGIGVNLANHPPEAETRWPATSVAALAGAAPTPEAALDTLAAAFARWQQVRARDGFAAIRAAWLARAAQKGGPVEIRLPRETVPGTFEDLDPDGRLLLRTEAGLRRIDAGDVFFAAGT